MLEVPDNFEEIQNPLEYKFKRGDKFWFSGAGNWELVMGYSGKMAASYFGKNDKLRIVTPSSKPPKKRFEDSRPYPHGY